MDENSNEKYSKYMEKLYKIYSWPEDPFSDEGRRRFEESLNVFKTLLKHEWLSSLVKGLSSVRIVDVCGGTGIGGIALGKVLRDELGLGVELTIVDIRRDVLSKAKRFSKEVLGVEAKTLVHDVREDMGIKSYYDIALLWGLTTPHFSPWDLIKVYANIAKMLKDGSLLMYDEGDRVYSIFYILGYKDVVAERVENGNVVLTVHKDREFRTGYMVRLAINLLTRDFVEMKIYFWDLAGSAALAWIFFEDVDFIPKDRPYRGIVIAKNPRKYVNVDAYIKSKPKILLES